MTNLQLELKLKALEEAQFQELDFGEPDFSKIPQENVAFEKPDDFGQSEIAELTNDIKPKKKKTTPVKKPVQLDYHTLNRQVVKENKPLDLKSSLNKEKTIENITDKSKPIGELQESDFKEPEFNETNFEEPDFEEPTFEEPNFSNQEIETKSSLSFGNSDGGVDEDLKLLKQTIVSPPTELFKEEQPQQPVITKEEPIAITIQAEVPHIKEPVQESYQEEVQNPTESMDDEDDTDDLYEKKSKKLRKEIDLSEVTIQPFKFLDKVPTGLRSSIISLLGVIFMIVVLFIFIQIVTSGMQQNQTQNAQLFDEPIQESQTTQSNDLLGKLISGIEEAEQSTNQTLEEITTEAYTQETATVSTEGRFNTLDELTTYIDENTKEAYNNEVNLSNKYKESSMSETDVRNQVIVYNKALSELQTLLVSNQGNYEAAGQMETYNMLLKNINTVVDYGNSLLTN